MYRANNNAIISNVYYDLSGYGAINETATYAKTIATPIKFSDAKLWFDNNVKSKNQNKGANFSSHMVRIKIIKSIGDWSII